MSAVMNWAGSEIDIDEIVGLNNVQEIGDRLSDQIAVPAALLRTA